MDATMATIIAIANQKGGVGKTTTTANLGVALAWLGRRVLLIDLDPQANLTAAFAVPTPLDATVAEALGDPTVALPIVTLADLYADPSHNGAGRDGRGTPLALVPASIALTTAEVALMSQSGRELLLRNHLLPIAKYFDFIVIDTPPALGLLVINALVAAHCVLIPTEARDFSIRGVQTVQDTIEHLRRVNPPLSVLGIMLSKIDRRLREERAVAAFLRNRWGELVMTTEIGTNSKILEAGSAGTYALVHQGRQPADWYLQLAREVMARTSRNLAPGTPRVPATDGSVDETASAPVLARAVGTSGEGSASAPTLARVGEWHPPTWPDTAAGAPIPLVGHSTQLAPLEPAAPESHRVLPFGSTSLLRLWWRSIRRRDRKAS
jgi:chromosome partitioning protein